MDEGWFAGCRAGDTAVGARRVREGSAETPREWPALAVESGFTESEAEYYDALGAATRQAAREAATERERADDKQLVHAVRAMDNILSHVIRAVSTNDRVFSDLVLNIEDEAISTT